MPERSNITMLIEQLHCIKQKGRSLSSDDLSKDAADDVYMKIYPDGNDDYTRWPEDGEINMSTGDYKDVNINVTFGSYVRVEVFEHDHVGDDDLLGFMKIDKPPNPVFNETIWVQGEGGQDGAKYELSYQFLN